MNASATTHVAPPAIAPMGLGPQARDLLDAALRLDLPQRRLLMAALRPGPKRDRDPVPPIRSDAACFWLPSDRDAMAARHAVYASPAWSRTFRPGITLHVYVLGTPGLQPLAVALGLSIVKIGTCQVGAYDERVGRLRRDRYGSVIRRGGAFVTEAGFDGWAPPPRLQLKAGPPLAPVRLSNMSLIVTLPEGVTHGLFEYDLNQALRSIALTAFADSDAGRRWCTARGIDPLDLIRYTATSADGTPEAATELMLLRPQADGPALAAVVETIVLGYLGLETAVRCPATFVQPERERQR